MGPEIFQPPSDIPNKRESQISSPQSPGQSTEAVSRLQSPWLDPSSPDLRNSPTFRGKHDSQMGLLGPNRAGNVRTGLGVFHTSSNKQGGQPDCWWQKLIKSKWSMVICLLLGVGGALGHHFLYAHLHDREARDQQWWLRLGQFVSFCTKASFAVSVLLAHQQVAWRAVGQKDHSVEAVDSLYGAVHNIMELFNREAWEAWNKSWLVMFLAM